MPDLNKHISIPKNIASGDDLDYSFLRKKGQEYIEQLASDIWTDYNEHDPGITILEMLAYAITDLGARIDLPLENLLAPEDDSAGKIEEQFFAASEILPSNPVSEADYRKLFIDIEGVKNCWLKPYKKKVFVDCKNDKLSYNPDDFKTTHEDFKSDFNLQGLYSIIVEYDDSDEENCPPEETEANHDEIDKEIRKRFHANRNLCEDLIDISKVEKHAVKVCAHVELDFEADEELVHAKVLNTIENYFSPSLKFYSLKQMFEKGYASDEIFEGPVLTNGFIDPKELEAAKLREEVRLSDLMKLIMAVDGVKVIKDISIDDCKNIADETDSWLICIEEGKKPCLCDESSFSYFKGVLPVNVNEKKVEDYQKEIQQAEKDAQEQAKYNMEIEIPEGIYLNTNQTTTILNDFPETYGIGRVGLPPRVETARKAKAKQLKGYLLFFDQILANYFAHLGKVKDLLSVDSQLAKTYFAQAVEDIRDFEELVSDYPANDNEELTEKLLSELDENVERRNKLLDHLIARFAEKFSDFAFLMKKLYGDYANHAILASKEDFLRDYNVTSRQRGSAFNYYNQDEEKLWDADNVAGVQKRISRLVGIKNYNRRNLSGSFAEIYELTDSGGNQVYRWRIRNTENKIVLSATENYDFPTKALAQEEMYFAVTKILLTPPEIVEEAFQNEILDEAEVGNFEIQVSESGKYSFDVINLEAEASSTDRIIARQFTEHNTQEELKQAILEIIDFMVKDFTEEGMFVVEHILLRPDVTKNTAPLDTFLPICTDNCTNCEPVDPYSFRITVILPGWTYRFSDPDFRKFLEELIRKEIPAHVLAKVCWIGYPKTSDEEENDMMDFEKAWKEYLFSKTDLEQEQNETKLKELIKILNELNSVYPEGKLIDCDDEDETLEGKIILGRTNIGNI